MRTVVSWSVRQPTRRSHIGIDDKASHFPRDRIYPLPSRRTFMTNKKRSASTSASRGPSKATRQTVWSRARGRCERCGNAPDWHSSVHHRQPRGMGGSRQSHLNKPSNLLFLCGSGTTGCHGWVESNRLQAVNDGFIVPRYGVPATTPVRYLGRDWVILDDEGGMSAWEPPADEDA